MNVNPVVLALLQQIEMSYSTNSFKMLQLYLLFCPVLYSSTRGVHAE